MFRYIVKRVILAVATVFIIAAITFFTMNAIPIQKTYNSSVASTKLGTAVKSVVINTMKRSMNVFLFSAAILPRIKPTIAAVIAAIPPSFADIGKDSPITVEMLLPVFKETPKSP